MTRFPHLALLACLVVAPKLVWGQEGGGDDQPTAAEMVNVSVHVQRFERGGATTNVTGHAVKLHVVVPPHQVLRTLVENTDDAGVARFSLEAREGAEAVAELDDGRRFFSSPVDISTAGEQSATLEAYAETSDPTVVSATTVQTIVEPWEGYVAITQVWNLTTNESVIYVPDIEDRSTLLRLPLPEGAEGIRVVQPEDTSRVVGTMVAFATEVSPPEMAERGGSHVVLQFSLKTHDLSDVSWEQALPMDVGDFAVIVPQASSFSRHPALDVGIDGPRCADETGAPEGAEGANTAFCFEYFGDDAGDLSLREDVALRIARGPGRAGQIVSVTTFGWPARNRWAQNASRAAALFALFCVVALFVRDRALRGDDPQALRRAALDARKEDLFAAAAELDRRLDDGLILQRDYDVARERIRHQLGVVYRRIREFDDGGAETSAQS